MIEEYIRNEHDYKERNELIALAYAERHGIIEYHINHKDGQMIYYTSFPLERKTYKAVVDLKKRKEVRTELDKYYEPYKSKIGGKWFADYCV